MKTNLIALIAFIASISISIPLLSAETSPRDSGKHHHWWHRHHDHHRSHGWHRPYHFHHHSWRRERREREISPTPQTQRQIEDSRRQNRQSKDLDKNLK